MKHISNNCRNSSSCGMKGLNGSWKMWELNVLKGGILGQWGGVVYLIKGAGIIGWPCGWMPSSIPNSHLSKNKL